jgi:pimeloyl-ACP methyl ester carboxylesterase
VEPREACEHDPVNDPIVLLHAAGHGPQMWRPQVEAFSPSYEVATPPLGDTDPAVRFTVASAADRIAAEIVCRPSGRAVLVGLSLGAFVALEVAARFPERVSALVLSGGQVHPSRWALAANYRLLTMLPSRLVVRDGGSRQAFLAAYRSLFEWDATARLADVTAPTLVLCGSRDRANLRGAQALAAGIPGATLQIVPGAGHLWNASHAAAFDDALRTVLA